MNATKIKQDAKSWLTYPDDTEEEFIDMVKNLYKLGAKEIIVEMWPNNCPDGIYIDLPEDREALIESMILIIESQPYLVELNNNVLYLWWD